MLVLFSLKSRFGRSDVLSGIHRCPEGPEQADVSLPEEHGARPAFGLRDLASVPQLARPHLRRVLTNGGKLALRRSACLVSRDSSVSELRTLLWAMPTDFLALMKPTARCHTGGDRAPGRAAPAACVYGSKRVPREVTDPRVDLVAIWSLLGGPHPQH